MASGFSPGRCLAVALALAVFLGNAHLCSPRPAPPPAGEDDIRYIPSDKTVVVLLTVVLCSVVGLLVCLCVFCCIPFIRATRPKTTILATVVLSDKAGDVASVLLDIFSSNNVTESQTAIYQGTVTALLQHQKSFIYGSLSVEMGLTNLEQYKSVKEMLRNRMRKEMQKLGIKRKSLHNHQLVPNLAPRQKNANTLVTLMVVAQGARSVPFIRKFVSTKEAVKEALNYFNTEVINILAADVIWTHVDDSSVSKLLDLEKLLA